jgi:Ca2+-binding RTX toxin-like protein
MQFGSVSKSGNGGSWALWDHFEDSTPRSELLEELNETTESWWGGGEGNEAYLQGVTLTGGVAADILVGTEAEDYLIAGAGDDVLISGAGDDGLNGGAGYDVLLLAGTATDYHIATEGDGYRLNGPDGSDFVINIEEFLFEDDSSFVFNDAEVTADAAALEFLSPLSALMLSRDASSLLGRTDLVSIENDVAVAAELQDGVMVQAVKRGSAIGNELVEMAGNVEEVYMISARGEVIEIGEHEVTANYWTLMANLDGKGGETLADTALDAVTALAGVAMKATEVLGTSGNDVFMGRDADDGFSGAAGTDSLHGRGGADRLRGGEGNDTLNGGAGEDIFIFDEGDGGDRINDFSAEDTLDLRGLGLEPGQSLEEFASLNSAGHLTLDFGDGDMIAFKGLGLNDVAWIDALI